MSDWALRIARFSLDGTRLMQDYGRDFSGLMIRCALPGWGQKAWFEAPAKSAAWARELHQTAHGQRIIIYDAAGPVWQGWLMAIGIDGRMVRYECAGTYAARMRDAYYAPTLDVTDTVPEFMQALLSAAAPAVTVAAGNFASNTTEIGDLFLQAIEQSNGVVPSDAIPALLAMSDASYNRYDFWLQPARWSGNRPQYDVAHYVMRDKQRARADWYLRVGDLVESDRVQYSHIYDYRDNITVQYGKITGTADVPAPPDYYLHAAVNLVDLGARVGDMATNLTRSAGTTPVYMFIAGFTDDGATATGGSGYNWYTGAVGDDYSIRLTMLGSVSASASNSGGLWSSVGQPVEAPELDQTQAAQWAEELAETFANPVYQEPFTIGGPWVRDGNGAKWPIWSLLRKPSYALIQDLYQYDQNDGYEISAVKRRGLYTSALDYNHDELTLTVTPNEASDRLDVALQAAGIVAGQTIESSRGGGIDPLAAAYIESFRRRGGGNAPLIFYDWRRFGPPPANWEEQMRAQGLNPQLGPNPEGMYRNG